MNGHKGTKGEQKERCLERARKVSPLFIKVMDDSWYYYFYLFFYDLEQKSAKLFYKEPES